MLDSRNVFRIRTGLAAFLALFLVSRVHAGEAYYLLMFGSQRTPTDPNYSHSWATFVRATWEGDGPCPENPTLEAHTISWLPRNLVIRVWAPHPECGVNLELQPTLDYVLDNCERVSLWGPYQIEKELYCRALEQIETLESGQVLYKANDSGRRSDRVSNCIHAVSTIAEGFRLRVASPAWGETASYAILERLMPLVIDRGQVHDWVGSALGLDEYPIIYRDFVAPRSGGILGPVNRLFGGERGATPTFGPPTP